jgi:plasmid stabilization system protein ParE
VQFGELRELVISYGRTGYVALYRFVIGRDEVRILALRHQRELGFLP